MTKVLLVAGGIAGSSGVESQDNPLGKVLGLMHDLSAKITKEAEAESAAFKEYFEWCDDVSKNTNFAIKTASAQKEKLEATIAELSANIQKSTTEIEASAEDIATGSADLKSATAIRTTESADFAAGEKELVEVVDTLTRATTLLEREMQKNPAALAQISGTKNLAELMNALGAVVDAASFSVSDKQRLASLVQSQEDTDEDSLGAPAAAVYKTHSSSILDVIGDLQEKAETQLSDLRKAEVGARHNYEMLKQSIEDQLANDNKEMDAAKSDKASAEESQAVAEGDLDVTVAELKASQEALDKANANCMQVAADHDATVQARAGELKVIAEAIKILESTTSGAAGRVYSLIQVSLNSRADLAKSEVVAFLKTLAKQHHSTALAQLASRITSLVRYGGADPFGKVKGLIQDMIAKLQAEASADATEKQFCDTEMAATAAKKEELDVSIEKLTTKIDQASARSAALKAEVKELQAELAKMAAEQAEAMKVRQETHAAYAAAKADLEQGLDGVRGALEMLRNYYAKAGAALLQQPEPPMPEAHSAATHSGSADSIIGILEVCEDDMATNLAKEETAESDAQGAYDELTQQNKISTAANEQDVKYKTKEHVSLDKSVSELSSDREGLSTQLDAVLDYDAKLKDRCIAKPETYETRAQRRQAEIAGLKEALSILENEVAFVQQRRGKHGHGAQMRGSLFAGQSH